MSAREEAVHSAFCQHQVKTRASDALETAF